MPPEADHHQESTDEAHTPLHLQRIPTRNTGSVDHHTKYVVPKLAERRGNSIGHTTTGELPTVGSKMVSS
jgi:hypothetical protein